ncbi:dethiobiotin synthase [Rhodocyclus tenuis]|uniref:ATP-dependent dethiobiotin synthetase BioD n=2 Tax=Rhodocyclus TaxID=1064 RepID=A0A6L5JX98_RHOTE|nr:dethiobiotin synthase [Rhodocyclus gracilis]MQY51997.1 dethiobiotin synthase [Rhodocyclus gracilis]NJA89749.1 dethiobiotin synthase [Rhodocyclus gracilis]
MTTPIPPARRPAWFIAGTDTGVGKTFVTCALLHALRQRGLRAVGMKPVASGTDVAGDNEDVSALADASNVDAPRALRNPYCFRAAIAPHIAAADEGVSVELPRIVDAFGELRALADATLVEGVGGFLVPLGDEIDAAQLAVALDLPVILVVGMRLGCINHALLSYEAITGRGLPVVGWVANRIDPDMPRVEENLATLARLLPAPLLGVVEHGVTPACAGAGLRLPD